MRQEETIKHVLCECPSDDHRHKQLHPDGDIRMWHYMTDPELCRKILERRFEELKLPDADAEDSE